jgi:hypothetical protein
VVMVGVLAERHPNHVVLSNGVKVAVAEGLLPKGAEFGRSLTITYTTEGEEMRAEHIELVVDWLIDWMDEHGQELLDADSLDVEPLEVEPPRARESAGPTSRVA